MKKMLAHEIGAHQWGILKEALGFEGSEKEFDDGLKKIVEKKRAKERDRNKRGPPGQGVGDRC